MSFKSLSVFDLDGTLLNCNSSVLYSSYLYKKKVLTPIDLLYSSYCFSRYTFFGLTVRQLHDKLLKLVLCGKFFKDFELHGDLFMEDLLHNMAYLPAIQALEQAKKLGHYTMILSSSPCFLVEPIAKRLGVNQWVSSRYLLDKKGKMVGFKELILGEDKAKWMLKKSLELGFQRHQTFAYTDSHLDLALLKAAGTPIVVNPTRKLKKIAEKFSWRQI